MAEYVCLRVCIFEGVRYEVGEVMSASEANNHFRTRSQILKILKAAGVRVSKDASNLDLAIVLVRKGLIPSTKKKRSSRHGR